MSKTYAELLDEVSVKITPNDAEFLAHLLKMYAAKNNLTTSTHLVNLHAQLLGIKAGN